MRSLPVLFVLAATTAGAANPSAPSAEVPDLAAAREVQLQRLHDYRIAGAFPVADDGMPISVFRDSRGHLCPMAHLIATSGRGDLVKTVADQSNALRLADVTEGPLVDWILDSGLTREEVILIQGAMTWEEYQVETPTPQMILAAKKEISQRLVKIEAQLRADTPKSLAIVRERLPVPHIASTAPVVPKALVATPEQQKLALNPPRFVARQRAAFVGGINSIVTAPNAVVRN